ENVFLAVVAQTRRGFRGHRVGAGAGFCQCVRSDQLTVRDPRKVFLFRCVGRKVDNWQQADTAFGAERRRKRSRASDVLADKRAAGLIKAETAELLGDVGANQSELSRLADE